MDLSVRQVFFLVSLIAQSVVFSKNHPSQNKNEDRETCNENAHPSRIDARHIEAGGIGYSEGYTSLDIFLAPSTTRRRFVPFLDMRGHVFNNGKYALNGGLGGRWGWGRLVYGVNAYYDFRHTTHHSYNQIGVGIETLGKRADFRANGYFPVGPKKSGLFGPAQFDKFVGNALYINGKYEYAMTGVNAECGIHFGRIRNMEFYAAFGPYYFKGDVGPGALGGEGRLRWRLKKILSLEVKNSYDAVFKNRFQGEVTLSLPLGSRAKRGNNTKSCTFWNDYAMRLAQPIDRQEIVVVKNHSKSVQAKDAFAQPYRFIFVNNESHSNGTIESPYPTLAQAEQNSQPGDIIYVFAGNGTTQGMDNGITLQAAQRLWGSGGSHLIQTQLGSLTIPATTATNPSITNGTGAAITLANGVSIDSFNIVSTTGDGISGNSVSDIVVSNMRITNSSGYGISWTTGQNSRAVIFSQVQLTNNAEGGVYVAATGGTSGEIALIDSTISSAPNVPGITISTSNGAILQGVVENSTVLHDNTSNGIFISAYDTSVLAFSLFNNKLIAASPSVPALSNGGLLAASNGTSVMCLTLVDNTSNTGYWLNQAPGNAYVILVTGLPVSQNGGTSGNEFNLAPTNVISVNSGTFYVDGSLNSVNGCDVLYTTTDEIREETH